MLVVGVVYAGLGVTLSWALDGSLTGPQVEVHPSSGVGSVDGAGSAVRVCTGCHVLNQMEASVGPHLAGIVGRPAGAVPGFEYSTSMRRADFRWTRERLREFLLHPQSVVPGTTMVAPRLDEGMADAVVNYLSRRN
jgi:cytochrome c